MRSSHSTLNLISSHLPSPRLYPISSHMSSNLTHT
jgi:hypothetical protein